MPELPEVETTRRGIAPHIEGHTVTDVIVREPRLRWPVPPALKAALRGQRLRRVARRSKYLLLHFDHGTLLLHLGMSGSLRVLPAGTPPQAHDHLDIVFDDDQCVRLRDPRRFGSVHWTRGDPADHPLLAALGPEPLGEDFTGDYLYARSRRRKSAVKVFLMDSKVVAGVGNIYANEALFRAGVHPGRAAGRISRERYARIAAAVREVLTAAIAAGGTTLRDFTLADGSPGYFRLSLAIYDRTGQPCLRCGQAIRESRLGQRSTFHCPHCQRS
ncbi:MAG TPA: bifunctional DNA-formamidopyrimidine glycosylase/DNA-(apurinic or apyrimidinic site) lyase [Gammaproteobacteria bacterium]|nr:bifunctional DNA-formamidopyrimidine glycosylase/DNA-(apurinic or apyrimidinic site) lyase [Gammaproteobacteria bacterium]